MSVTSPVTSSVVSGVSQSVTGIPSWVEAGAFQAWDFANNRFWNGAYDYAGAAGYALNSDDDYEAFSANALRRTDIGATIEAAQTYLVTRSYDLSDADWSDGGASSSAAAGTYAALFDDPYTIASTGNANGGRQNDSVSVTSGQAVTVIVRYAIGTSGKFMVRLIDPNTFNATKVSNSGSLSGLAGSADAGAVADIVDTDFSDHRELKVKFTPNFTGPLRVRLGPDSSSAGENVIGIGAEVIAGDVGRFLPNPTEDSTIARAADNLDLDIIEGGHDLVITFDDDSTQTVNSVSAGSYDVPTTLDRRVIKSAVLKDA